MMFRGRFEHTVDAKGRLSIPARFREVLNERYDSRLVVTTYDGCLIVYPYQERVFLRFFYSSASDCPIDKLGRILIQQPLREYARLEKDVILVGAFKQFEIWSKAVWNASESGASREDISNMLESLGI